MHCMAGWVPDVSVVNERATFVILAWDPKYGIW